MDEQTSGRLELTGARARALFGARAPAAAASAAESSNAGAAPIGGVDAERLTARILATSAVAPEAAAAIADELVVRARTALEKLERNASDPLTELDAVALESVIHVRGRPALRVLDTRLESLDAFPGSEFWQEFITDSEDRIVGAAAVTGAAIVTAFEGGNPPWVQGTAWLVARDRVVTNRHVLLSPTGDVRLVEPTVGGSAATLRPGHTIEIEFAADDRTPRARVRRKVTAVPYLAKASDPVDVAVLAIEAYDDRAPLALAAASAQAPNNVFVVGHPALMAAVPPEVKAVFGTPDGRKRVSFGRRLTIAGLAGKIAYDASTIGGYSGGPVVGISDGVVAGLHYFGDPGAGNLAISAGALRGHASHAAMGATP